MEQLVHLERKVQSIYDDVLEPLGRRTAFDLPTSQKEAPGLPTVLFLGNHSSGKSSFINYLIQADLQKTGLAPTDDGFTIITYGEKKDEFDGQTVVTHRDLAFRKLQELGPAFLARLRLKTYPNELLKSVTLVDSPGMIDAAGNANTRGYDFSASVRHFAQRADLILFFFDPDKPGTTGETVSIFTETLAGLSHKLMIILHKVDLFRNIRDFARTYGTLCWNLSKTIKSKDMPHIYNTYLPQAGSSAASGSSGAVPWQDFDASREEVIGEIKRAPTRRADNLVSDLYQNARRLAMHVRVCTEVARHYRNLRRNGWLAIAAVLLAGGFIAWLTWDPKAMGVPLMIALGALVVGGGIWFVSQVYLKKFQQTAASPSGIETYFAQAYREELTMRDRADLRGWWESVRDQTIATLRALGPRRIPRSFMTKRPLRHLERVLETDIPQLRRDIAEHHRQLRSTPLLQTAAKP